MKKKLVAIVIGAGDESVHAINEARKMGFKIFAFDGNPMAEGFSFVDTSYVFDISSAELLIQKINDLQIVPDIILPVPIGQYLTTIGKINDYYHLSGVNYEIADYCTDKYKFHLLLSENHLRNVNCELIRKYDTRINHNFISDVYPVIIKPRYGSGSRSVYIVNNYKELKDKFINQMPYNEDYIIEDVKSGTEYGIDAAIINNQFQLILLREKILTPYPYRQCTGYYSVLEDENNHVLFEKTNNFMKELMKIMKLNNILLHADIIYDGKDVFLIEISARPSGHNLHNLFTPLVTGIDMIGEYVKFAVPELQQKYTFYPKWTKCMLIRYFDFENCKVLSIPDKNELMNKYPLIKFECNCNGQAMEKIVDSDSLMNRGYFILEGKTRQELEYFSKNILDEFVLERNI